MKHMKFSMIAVLFAICAASPAHADVAGASSDISKVQVGPTAAPPSGHPGAEGLPGIGVHSSVTPFRLISLAGLKAIAQNTDNYNKNTKVAHITPGIMPSGHQGFGHFNIGDRSKGSSSVYFGEWSQNGAMTGATRSVFYAGKNRTTAMPSTGTASYSVRGLNNYNPTSPNLLTGTFTANFGTKKLTGSIANPALTVDVNATIAPSNASFGGVATATPAGGTAVNGGMQGNFFGSQAGLLAGIATFGENNRALNTAFGGKKKP